MSTSRPSSEQVAQALRARVGGEVLVDERTLDRYSTDQSMYQVRPLAVVIPNDLGDVVATVTFCRDAGIPLTPRGGGSGTAGAALGRGIVLAFRRIGPMNRILGFEEVGGEPQVAVEPALLHDDLQAFLRARGQRM